MIRQLPRQIEYLFWVVKMDARDRCLHNTRLIHAPAYT